MDATLVESLIDRDWEPFVRGCRTLAIGSPVRTGDRILIPCHPAGTDDPYVAAVSCDDYDVQAPLLDFADPNDHNAVGREWWPRMTSAPYNNIVIASRHVPILCVKGTRGYHLHPSHNSERYERTAWRLPETATLLHRLLHQWGPYIGRGL